MFDRTSIPEHARCSVSKEMYEIISKSHGPEKAFEMCRIALEKPMMTIRANTLKTTRSELIKTLTSREYGFDVTECKYAPNGIRFYRNPE